MPAYKYKFRVSNSSDSVTIEAKPLYKNLQISKIKNAPQMYFRTSLDTELTFVGADYEYLERKPIHTTFTIDIRDAKTGDNIIRATFRYVDMAINTSIGEIQVKPKVKDGYDKVLENLNTEYDLFKLSPSMRSVKYGFSNTLQITGVLSGETCNVYGSTVVTKDSPALVGAELVDAGFSNRYAVSNIQLKTVDGTDERVLFPCSVAQNFMFPTADRYEEKLSRYYDQGGIYTAYINKLILSSFSIGGKDYWLEVWVSLVNKPTVAYYYSIYLVDKDAQGQFRKTLMSGESFPGGEGSATGGRVSEKNKIENLYADTRNDVPVDVVIPMGGRLVKLKIHSCYFNTLHSRILSIEQGQAKLDPSTDAFLYSNAYKYRTAIDMPTGAIAISNNLSANPTEYGMACEITGRAGKQIFYYAKPDGPDHYEPFAYGDWGESFSMWVNLSLLEEPFFSTKYDVVNKNFCEIGEAIRLLLKEIDGSLSFESSSEYSEFLYGTQGFRLSSFTDKTKPIGLYVTQMSNANKPNSDNYAVKGKITLAQILNMLCYAFNVYWYIDGNRFRLEHVRWFLTSGSYEQGSRHVLDLKRYKDRFNKKLLSYHTGDRTFDLSEEYSKSKLSWTSQTSKPFSECKVTLLDSFDDADRLVENSIQNMTPDIEYCAVFGKDLPNEGLAVVACREGFDDLTVDSPVVDGVTVVNGNFAINVLYSTWLNYNMPSQRIDVNGALRGVRFPNFVEHNTVTIPTSLMVPNVYSEVITEAGGGHISKMTIDLDTETAQIELYYGRKLKSL